MTRLSTPAPPWRDDQGGLGGECLRRGLIEPFESGDSGRDRSRKRSEFRKAQSELLAAKWIGIDGERVMDLSRGYK